MRTHIFNVSAILSADNIKNTNAFLLEGEREREREREREHTMTILRKGGGRKRL